MGTCKYCGKDAGFLSSKHSVCEMAFNDGRRKLLTILQSVFISKKDFYLLDNEIQKTAQSSYINKTELDSIYVEALDNAIELFLNDNVISQDENTIVARFQQYTGLSQSVLNINKSLDKVVQSSILQNLIAGNIQSPNITITGDFPFLLQKNEKVLWLYRNVDYYEQKIKTEFRGRSNGLSFRVAKGIYYRIGGFKGSPIETTCNQHIGKGSLCLTDKHIYFSSLQKTVKIPYSKLINLEPYSDGVGLQKDGNSAKPIYFTGVDSWFIYNLISNLIYYKQ